MAMTTAQLEAKLNELETRLTPSDKKSGPELLGNIGVGVATAVIIGVLTLIGNWASQGGLVGILGGVTVKDLPEQIVDQVKKLNIKGEQGLKGDRGDRGAKGENATIPAGMIVAFDLPSGCPSGWTVFERGISRTIIGANPPNGGGARNLDQNNNPLSIRGFREVGGVETNVVGLEQLPNLMLHSEELKLVYLTDQGPTPSLALVRTAAPVGPTSIETRLPGGGQPLNNMPPFISLVYCGKD